MYAAGTNRMRMRMFHTQQDVHPNHIFSPVVTAPSVSADYKPRVDWSKFHEVVALQSDELKSPHLDHVSKSWGALSGRRCWLKCKSLCTGCLWATQCGCYTCLASQADVSVQRHQGQTLCLVNKLTWMQAVRLPVRLALPASSLAGMRL